MATARFLINILLLLATLESINCQSYGTIPTTLARIESQLGDVSTSTEQMATILDKHDQLLDITVSQQNVQTQLLASMVSLLQKHDEQLQNITDQQNIQNQILATQTSLLQGQIKQQLSQNQILTNVAGLLQKHDKQLTNITEQQSAQNQIMTTQTSLLQGQTQQLQLLSEKDNVQNQILNNMVGLLQAHEQQFDNITEHQIVQSQIFTTQTSLLQGQMQQLQFLSDQHNAEPNQHLENVASSLQNISHSFHNIATFKLDNMAISCATTMQQLPLLLKTMGPPTEYATIETTTDSTTMKPTIIDSITKEPSTDSITMEPTTDPTTMEPTSNLTVRDPILATQPPSPTRSPQDCSDIKDRGFTENYGIYRIQPSGDSESFDVVCDLKTSREEWIVFQRRFDGSEDFYRSWEDYKWGFGNLTGEHWLGLEKLHRLTKNGNWLLRVELVAKNIEGKTGSIEYSNFAIGDESTYYRLSVGDSSGCAGDSLKSRYTSDISFSTYDQDHDNRNYNNYNMAEDRRGGWWYDSDAWANLNGLYYEVQATTGPTMGWYDWKGSWSLLIKTEMKMTRIF